MDNATAGALAEFLKLGFSGAVIIVLLFICNRLFNLYVEIQEKRIIESREALDAISKNTSAMIALSEFVKERNR